MPLEALDRPLVLFGLFHGRERSQIAPLSSLGILLARVKTVFAGFQFTDHMEFGWRLFAKCSPKRQTAVRFRTGFPTNDHGLEASNVQTIARSLIFGGDGAWGTMAEMLLNQ